MQRIIPTIFLFLASTLAFAAQPAPEIRLVIDESSVLPGTPTGLSVFVSNRNDDELQLPAALWLTATNEAGQTFTLRAQPTTDGAAAAVPSELRTIPTGASRELRYDPTVVIAGSPWLTDDRLLPGRYKLRAVFASQVQPDGTFDAAGAMVSNEVVLDVAVESADDGAVWSWMQEQGGGRWGDRAWVSPRADFAAFVMKHHPASHYALFAAPFLPMRDHGEPSPLVEEQARLYPARAFSDQVKLLLVQYHVQALHTARKRADLYRASIESDAARALASELVRESRSSVVRATAKDLFDRTPTSKQLVAKQK